MTSPLTGDRPQNRSRRGAADPAHARRPRSRALFTGRLHRSVQRQWLTALLIAAAVGGGGGAYYVATGSAPIAAALFWAPLGAGVGLAVALIHELGRSTITSLSSFGRNRSYSVLGAAPELTQASLRQLPPHQRTPLGCLAFQPASPFATAFRDLQSAMGQDMVAFVAALPGEGATTSALCAAVSATQQGRHVIIVDCDIRHRTLTRALGVQPDLGVLDACDAPDTWRRLVGEEEETGLHFLPAARPRNPWRSLLGTQGFALLIGELRGAYDLVVLDCPPALSSADGPILASMADKTVLVTAWDRTPLSAVRQSMRILQRLQAHAGVYVNR
ncbi:MAG: CpsD/CapB family tyrosine-protein kinase, partial [Vitreimonas sp.]